MSTQPTDLPRSKRQQAFIIAHRPELLARGRQAFALWTQGFKYHEIGKMLSMSPSRASSLSRTYQLSKQSKKENPCH